MCKIYDLLKKYTIIITLNLNKYKDVMKPNVINYKEIITHKIHFLIQLYLVTFNCITLIWFIISTH